MKTKSFSSIAARKIVFIPSHLQQSVMLKLMLNEIFISDCIQLVVFFNFRLKQSVSNRMFWYGINSDTFDRIHVADDWLLLTFYFVRSFRSQCSILVLEIECARMRWEGEREIEK